LKTFTDFQIDTKGKTFGQIKTLCSECSHTRTKKHEPCLSVDLDRGLWNCHNCGWNGSLNNDHKPSFKAQPENSQQYPRPKYFWPQELPEKIYNFLVDERNIPEHVLTRNKIGFENGWIQFPFIKTGEVVNIKSRSLGKQFKQVPGAEKIVYGYDDISNEMTLIVEGELDKLALEAAGYPNSISVPDGAPAPGTKNYSNKFSFLDNCGDRMNEVKHFVIAVDTDEPGKILEQELARRLGLGRCSRIVWPEGVKDANECLINFGPEKIKQVIESAIPFPVEGIYWVNDLDVESLYDCGLAPGLDTGWLSLDRLFTISQESGELTVVTGIPGHGKSEFLDALIINLANNEGWNIGIFSPENYPLEGHVAKLMEKYIGKPFREGFKSRMSKDELRSAQNWLNDHFSFLMPDEKNLSVDAVLDLSKTLVYRRGIKALILDPWNEIDHSRPNGITETEYISSCLTKVRRFARNHLCHVFLVAHPYKMQKGGNGKYTCPTPYDISGSAHWRNKADNCLAVWRDISPENPSFEIEIHVQKVKKKHIGRLGIAILRYEYSTGRYFDIENP